MSHSLLGDRCQTCDPKAAPVVYPRIVNADAHDSLRAEYDCPKCHASWPCWWNREAAGWPADWESSGQPTHSGYHASACYRREVCPCPSCGVPVRQVRKFCGLPDSAPLSECVACSMRCPDCPAEVRISLPPSGTAVRVVHEATCLWWKRYQAREVTGCIPCGVRVTHRGPYRQRREAA